MLSFFAGFIDAVVGGGGLIQVPGLFIIYHQMPHVNIIATNRLSSIGETFMAVKQYSKHLNIDLKQLIFIGICTAVFSLVGAYFISTISTENFKKIIIIIVLVMAIYTIIKKDFGQKENLRFKPQKTFLLSCLIGAVMGFYNGFIGPGTGSLLLFLIVGFLVYSF